jgi:hypothetical protein
VLTQQPPSALADQLDAYDSFFREISSDELQILDGGEHDGDRILQPAKETQGSQVLYLKPHVITCIHAYF